MNKKEGMHNKYIKNVFTDKAPNFRQESFYPVEYTDGGRISAKSEPQKNSPKRRKTNKDNGGKKVFSSDDIEY